MTQFTGVASNADDRALPPPLPTPRPHGAGRTETSARTTGVVDTALGGRPSGVDRVKRPPWHRSTRGSARSAATNPYVLERAMQMRRNVRPSRLFQAVYFITVRERGHVFAFVARSSVVDEF